MSGVMVNNIIPGWIGIGGNELASYIPGLGLSPITTAGYAGYDNAAAAFFPANSAASATQNIKLAGTTTVPLGGLTLNSVNTSTGTGNILFSNSSDLLSLTAGTLMKPAGNATYIGFFPGSGRLTSLLPAASGVSPLYVHSHAQAYTINSSIVDNGATRSARSSPSTTRVRSPSLPRRTATPAARSSTAGVRAVVPVRSPWAPAPTSRPVVSPCPRRTSHRSWAASSTRPTSSRPTPPAPSTSSAPTPSPAWSSTPAVAGRIRAAPRLALPPKTS